MTLNSHPAPVPVPDVVSAYLARTGLAQRSARVVPLTGDASDRRYFRVIESDRRDIRPGAVRRPRSSTTS